MKQRRLSSGNIKTSKHTEKTTTKYMKFKPNSELIDPEEGGNMVLKNAIILSHHYTGSQPRGQQLEPQNQESSGG